MGNLNLNEVREAFSYSDGNLYWKSPNAKRVSVGDLAGYNHPKGYRIVKLNNKPYSVHRVIFLYHHGYLPEQIDHINNKKDDNRIENLRACNNAENQQNQGLCKVNTSGVKGVSWYKATKKWVACIYTNGKNKNLGYYSDINQAKDAAIKERNKLHGSFANHG